MFKFSYNKMVGSWRAEVHWENSCLLMASSKASSRASALDAEEHPANGRQGRLRPS